MLKIGYEYISRASVQEPGRRSFPQSDHVLTAVRDRLFETYKKVPSCLDILGRPSRHFVAGESDIAQDHQWLVAK